MDDGIKVLDVVDTATGKVVCGPEVYYDLVSLEVQRHAMEKCFPVPNFAVRTCSLRSYEGK